MLRRAFVLLAVLAACLACAAPATAKGPVLELAGAQAFAGSRVLLAGQKLALRATAPGAQPGSTVVITWKLNGKRARRTTQPLADGGQAFDSLKIELPGTVTISANLRGPDASDAGTASALRVTALLPYATRGATGLRVRFLQAKLAALGYAVPVNGVFDVKTEFAVIAFRKVNRQARTSVASRGVFNAVAAGRGAYRPRFPGAGRHVEFDRRRQVLALVEAGGGGIRVFHSSSGRPRFRTPLGSFRFWHKEPGLNDRGMLHSVYFTHDKKSKPTRPACAVHGYFAVPTYPYSHCCLRVGLWDALYIHRWIHLGERVYIYV
jgi:L,D-transpeptidase catalytic domain/Putative peptidoglycan binding domain